ncbi:hypothetical protein HPC49_04855 [Pyxidicoccus fallax]|uniref:Lipoprotein n=1 Tax=Pyxidicoccus fallax TaxID=394095 RepID=A0A848L704_9BACT|nr:hypothetical protein [Pyxidicoccus fallax]NMO14414.1 hypothetical protein [Pyxidicoccus fallax]NPC77581.1 hypothetical protein [Pyxidicoccus fallax]
MHRCCPRSLFVVATALAVLAGCAPTAMGPMVMRLGPGDPSKRLGQLGVRTGPRLSAPIAGSQPNLSPGDRFRGDDASFSTQQWGMAFDAAMTWPLTERLHLHTGLQGEFFLPLPIPGYGLYAGTSYYVGSERLGLAPALALRGASDFGIGNPRGGPGNMFGAEASCAFTFQPEKDVSLGFIPFFAWHTVGSSGMSDSSVYYGGALAARFSWGWLDNVELSGGFGRVTMDNGASWNVPIVGVRGGR